MEMLDFIKIVLMAQLFFSFSMTTVSYAIPDDALHYMAIYTDEEYIYTLDELSTTFEDNLKLQTEVPIIELGSLLFYSGNYLLDLVLNFIYAFPAIFGLLIKGLLFLISVDAVIANNLTVLMWGVTTVIYVIGIFQLITRVRSGQLI